MNMTRIAILLIACSLVGPALAIADIFELDWYTIDGGGGISSVGGTFDLSGTIGQPDATTVVMAGGSFELTGGFWAGAAAAAPLLRGDMNCDELVNNFDIDAFVTALVNPVQYAVQYPGCDPMHGDVNQDQAFNNFDIDPFVGCLLNGGCP